MRIRVTRGPREVATLEADTPLHGIMVAVFVPGHEREFDTIRHAGSVSAEVVTSGIVYRGEVVDG